VEATEQLLRQYGADETLEERIITDFLPSPPSSNYGRIGLAG
jgi:hypothetical protein